jgi:hypothetical protein
MRTILAFSVLVSIAAQGAASETITYQYDALGRLVSVTRTGTVNNGAAATYTYDPANNRTNVTTTAPGGGGMALRQPATEDKQGQTAGAANGSPRK